MFKPKSNLLMIFPEEQKISLHMFFVFYPIDVLVVDKNKKIIEIKRNFEPFTLWKSKKEGKYIIEFAYSSEYKLGDKLKPKLRIKKKVKIIIKPSFFLL